MSSNEDNLNVIKTTFDEELSQEFQILSNEFQTLGLPDLDDLHPYKRLMLLQVIDNVHSLINMHRKIINEKSETDLKTVNLTKDVQSLNKIIDSIKYDISLKNSQINTLKNNMSMKELELENVKKQNNELIDKMNYLKSQIHSQDNEYKHVVKRLTNDNCNLEQKLTTGTFKSKDIRICEALNKYKVKEEIYKETIQQLEENHRHLLKEVLNLREMIVDAISERED